MVTRSSSSKTPDYFTNVVLTRVDDVTMRATCALEPVLELALYGDAHGNRGVFTLDEINELFTSLYGTISQNSPLIGWNHIGDIIVFIYGRPQ